MQRITPPPLMGGGREGGGGWYAEDRLGNRRALSTRTRSHAELGEEFGLGLAWLVVGEFVTRGF